jgi:hypothetical protein
MKNLLLSSILTSITLLTYAQTYFPFPNSNAIWNNKSYWSPYILIERYGIYGDTIVNNKLYNKLYLIENDSTLNINNMTYYAAIRENNAKQIFVKFTNYNDEILIYDFSLNIGDTIHSNSPNGYLSWLTCTISDIDTIELENYQFRRRFRINNSGEYWIEGIGSEGGLFYPISEYLAGTTNDLLCFKQNDTLIYINNPECDKCFCSLATAIQNHAKTNNSLKIYSNPSTVEIFFEPPFEKGLFIINLYNSNGYLINTIKESSFPLSLKIKDLPLGIYFIQLIRGELVYGQKFIKKE